MDANQRTKHEQAIIEWQSSETILEDEIHRHFRELALLDWCDIAREGERLLGLVSGNSCDPDLFETEGPIELIICGVAAAAQSGAYLSVAAALGIDALALELALADWNENKDDLSPPITVADLLARVKQIAEELDAKPATASLPPTAAAL